MLGHRSICCLAALGLMALTSPARASAWNYGCKGALPVFNDSEVIIFNRESLFLLPKAWLKGTLRDLLLRDASNDVIEVAKSVDMNSGLVPNMVFTLLEHPDKKLTLTEKSSKTISDARQRAGAQPRFAQTTVYTKVYHYVSDFGYLGPFDLKLDCIDYQLSAPLR
jgi:hypothetical protein